MLTTRPHVATTASGAHATWWNDLGPPRVGHDDRHRWSAGPPRARRRQASASFFFFHLDLRAHFQLCQAGLPHHGSSGDDTTTATGRGADVRGVHRAAAPALFPT
eukprot:TRINITY_DN298_c0_g1_i4.p5 TRINITY_DN298_c0_g1~~TRINITY_DN298_c0_g1_i4.p5  ORF type:complete len:105 (+),score=10.30 TRINITY_DN298_c0_g1_i4:434-748(+)